MRCYADTKICLASCGEKPATLTGFRTRTRNMSEPARERRYRTAALRDVLLRPVRLRLVEPSVANQYLDEILIRS
jgi:hypothetical protein